MVSRRPNLSPSREREEVTRHLEPIIIERINGFFGYRAVARLAIRQGPLPQRPTPRLTEPRALTRTETAALEQGVQTVEDPDLCASVAPRLPQPRWRNSAAINDCRFRPARLS
jgi:hypothetical protein